MVLVKRIWKKLSTTLKPSSTLKERRRRQRKRKLKRRNNNNYNNNNKSKAEEAEEDYHHHNQKKTPNKQQQQPQIQKSMSMGGKCSKQGSQVSSEMDNNLEDDGSVHEDHDHDQHSDHDSHSSSNNGKRRVYDRPRDHIKAVIKPTIANIPPLSPVRSPPHKKRTLKSNNHRKFSGLFRVGSRAVRPPGHNNEGNEGDARKPAAAARGYPHNNHPPHNHNDIPHSPCARASTYSHVHDAVMYNLSEAEISKHDQTVPMGVIGLRNLGNTCFINSSLQCLSATIPLADYFLGYDYRSEINKSNFLGTGGKLVVAYAELMKQMWLGSKSVVDPTDFKKQLGTFAPQFSGYHQHDTQELLAFLLDGIHEDLNRVKERPYIEDKDCDGTNDEIDAIQCWKNYLRRNKSLVVDLFQGQLKNTCHCLKCGHINIRFEPFMYLSLPITDKCRSVDDCIDLFLKEETLKGADQWYCEKCKKHVDATKKIDLWILPPILIVHLKRFKYNDFGKVGSKNDASIKYPYSQWDLKPHVQSQGGVYPIYDLYAVSNHMGSLGGGHYTALALNRFDDLWYEFNDSSYRSVSGETAHRNPKQTKAAYVLFYNRCEGNDLSVPLNERSPMIRRQSVSRPDLWPHTQVDDRDKVRNFTRSHGRHHPSHATASPNPQRNRSGSHDNHYYANNNSNSHSTTTTTRRRLHGNHQNQQNHRYPTRSRAGTDPLSTYHQPSAAAKSTSTSSTSNGGGNNNNSNNQRYQLRSRSGSDDPSSLYQQQQQKSTTRSSSGSSGNSRPHQNNKNIDIVRSNSKDPPGSRGGSVSLRNGQRNHSQQSSATTRVRSSQSRSKSPSPGRRGGGTTATTGRTVRS